jgi:hypothetical protein
LAQGVEIPNNTKAIFELLQSQLQDRAVIGVMLADMIAYIPLKIDEQLELKKYMLAAIQA